MKNQNIFYIVIGIVILLGGYFVFNSSFTSPKQESVTTSAVDLKDGDTYDLTASYVTKVIGGKQQVLLAYNGSIPGPTIRVKQGTEVTVNFKNDTDLPALLHSHGVRMDNAFDGSQLQQKDMKPGESFAYKLKFPDAGVYWYHPHVKEVYGQGLGLYGAFIVTPADTSLRRQGFGGQAYFPQVNREMPLFLSDLPIVNGNITLDKNKTSHSLMGHFGNVMLVNGEEKYNLQAKSGEVIRLYVVNVANTRPYNFAIEGLKLKLIGADNGAYEKASFVDSVILGPSERAIVDVLLPKTGTYEIQNNPPVGGLDAVYSLGVISVTPEKIDVSYESVFNVLQNNIATTRSIDPFRSLFDTTPGKRIALTLDMGGNMMGDGMMGGSMMSGSSGGIEWEDDMVMMNAMSNTDSVKWKIKDQDTGEENMNIDWVFKQGKPVKIRIFNDPKSTHPMQHPIHFHGQRFLVVARDGVKQTNLVWKDTTFVKAGETVDIILDPSNPGEWMAHCHISEHLEAGMMFSFQVE